MQVLWLKEHMQDNGSSAKVEEAGRRRECQGARGGEVEQDVT